MKFNLLQISSFVVFIICTYSSSGQVPSFPLNQEKLSKARALEQLAIRSKDSAQLAEAYYMYGKTHSIAGNYHEAKKFFMKSLRLLEPLGDSYELGRIYIRLSENIQTMANPEEIRFSRRAFEVFKRIGSERGIALALSNQGQLHSLLSVRDKEPKHVDSAKNCYIQFYQISRKLNDSLGVAEAGIHLAEFYVDSDLPKAVKYLEGALPYLRKDANMRTRLTTMLMLCQLYIRSGQVSAGEKLLTEANQIYSNHNMADHQISTHIDKAYITYYEATGQWKLAERRYAKLYTYDVIRFRTESEGALLRLQVEYQTDKRETQIRTQQKELALNNAILKTQRTFIAATIALLFIAMVLAVLFFRSSRKNKRTSLLNKQLVREQNHRAKNNLQMLTSLFNMQERLIENTEAKKAMEENRLRIQSMAIIQRKLYDDELHLNLREYVTELIDSVLHAYGFDHTRRDITIDEVTPETDKMLALGLIITELATNACKYALPLVDDPKLEVQATLDGGKIRLSFADNGPGFNRPVSSTHPLDNFHALNSTSFGMKLIDLQALQLYGTYQFESDQGLRFTMSFPA